MVSPTASEVEREENELNKSIDEYADLYMDADMVEDDDLLDENVETLENFESLENENTEEAEKEDGQIEAIARLSQNTLKNKESSKPSSSTLI